MPFRGWKSLETIEILGSRILRFQERPAPGEQTVLNHEPTAFCRCFADVQLTGESRVYLCCGYALHLPCGKDLIAHQKLIEEWASKCATILAQAHRQRTEKARNLGLPMPQPEVMVQPIKWFKVNADLGVIEPMVRPAE